MNPTDPDRGHRTGLVPGANRKWQAADCPFTIEFAGPVLEQIRKRAEESFLALPHGGLDTGGVLFGRVHPNARMPQRIEIVAERPMECKHGEGPWLVLSEEEKAEVTALLARSRVDPELAAFSVAGFWVSHGRGELTLSPNDRELYGSLFSHPWQVALVLQPRLGAPTRAAYFFRSGGEISAPAPGHEFVAGTGADLAAEAPPAGTEKYKPIPKERRGEAVTEPPPKPFGTLRTVTVILAVLLALETGAGLTAIWAILQKPEAELMPEVFQAGSGLLIHWNAQSDAVRNARSGECEVDRAGGSPDILGLDAATLERGYLRYQPSPGEVRQGDVRVILRLRGMDGTVRQRVAVRR